MQDPRKLEVSARARSLALDVYRVTAGFPDAERYGLTLQMRRAAVGVGSCIFEGCGRNGPKELIQYLHMATGSVNELDFQSMIAGDLKFLSADAGEHLAEELNHTKRTLISLIGTINRRRDGA